MTLVRKIVHIDMDAFFASVEQRDNSALQGLPVIVGGRPESRGVVATASYEARRFGIRSAMPSREAIRRCPHAVFIAPRIAVYQRVSRVIMSILREFTDLVEPLSLDEAYLDVTRNKKNLRYASQVACEARKKIYEFTGLTASAGVAQNKFLAKLASDKNKPAGQCVVRPDEVDTFLVPLPVRAIPGVGRVMEEKLARTGIITIGQLRQKKEIDLQRFFGNQAGRFYALARGIDDRAVVPARQRKSIGSEDTFSRDTTDRQYIAQKISLHAADVSKRLAHTDLVAKTVTLKIKFADFQLLTRSQSVEPGTVDPGIIEAVALELFAQLSTETNPIRLVGVSVHLLRSTGTEEPQLCLGF